MLRWKRRKRNQLTSKRETGKWPYFKVDIALTACGIGGEIWQQNIFKGPFEDVIPEGFEGIGMAGRAGL